MRSSTSTTGGTSRRTRSPLGPDGPGLRWALTAFRSANWHPLTWVSHMADVELLGPEPGAHHVVNAALHAANAVVLFLVLRAATAAFWPSALVAALFAVHPLNVESVAWVSQRKSVLSTLFLFLTVGAYLSWVRRRGAGRSLLVALVFALGLLAKPMLVSVPLLLLLLDFWPLGRTETTGPDSGRSSSRSCRSSPSRPRPSSRRSSPSRAAGGGLDGRPSLSRNGSRTRPCRA